MTKKIAATQNDPGTSLIQTIISPELGGVMADFGEIVLDSVMKDGILKDLPVIGTIVGISKAAISMRDKIFVEKTLLFLREISDTTDEEEKRKEFLREFEEDPKKQRKVGENLLMLLDRLDDLDKPAMIAKLLKACFRKQISYEGFKYYASIVDRSSMHDLSPLLLRFSQNPISGLDENEFGRRFHYLGLSSMTVTVNPNFRPESGDAFDRAKQRAQQQRNPTNKANVGFKLSQNAYVFAKILLGDGYKGGEYPLEQHQ